MCAYTCFIIDVVGYSQVEEEQKWREKEQVNKKRSRKTRVSRKWKGEFK
jgi:hypothetical protein